MFLFFIFLRLSLEASAYLSSGKEHFLANDFLRDVVSRIEKDLDGSAYLDFPDGRLPVGSRSLEEEKLFPLDYDSLDDTNWHPSLRDQEFLEHSSLWGSHFISGDAGEGNQPLTPEGNLNNHHEVKADTTLPAYCNPPNPCPLGYTGEQGCLEEFENTASFSRRYQAAQDCMCDSEHMFDCPNPAVESPSDDALDTLNDLEFNRFLQHTMQVDPNLQHKNLVAKKYYTRKSLKTNPFLSGERLPVAAKKGNHVMF